MPSRDLRVSHRRYWLALLRRDVATAEQIVELAMQQWPPQRIYLKLFQPALAMSGTHWASGAITFEDEHYITHQTQRLMRRVRRIFVKPNPTGPVALATTVAQQHHSIGLRMVCDFLQWDNWQIEWTRFNDRSVVCQTLAHVKPSVVLISVGIGAGIVHVARLIRYMRRCKYNGLIAVGGRAIALEPDVVPRIGANLTARDGLDLVRKIRPMLRERERGLLGDSVHGEVLSPDAENLQSDDVS